MDKVMKSAQIMSHKWKIQLFLYVSGKIQELSCKGKLDIPPSFRVPRENFVTQQRNIYERGVLNFNKPLWSADHSKETHGLSLKNLSEFYV